jgi:hypothetical protein
MPAPDVSETFIDDAFNRLTQTTINSSSVTLGLDPLQHASKTGESSAGAAIRRTGEVANGSAVATSATAEAR